MKKKQLGGRREKKENLPREPFAGIGLKTPLSAAEGNEKEKREKQERKQR
jgi:hypothetical protein